MRSQPAVTRIIEVGRDGISREIVATLLRAAKGDAR